MEKLLEEPIYCTKCKMKRDHKIIHNNVSKDVDEYAEYITAECIFCRKMTFVYNEWNKIRIENKDGSRTFKHKYNTYPNVSGKYDYVKEDFPHVPKEIVELYSQVISVFNQSYYILCAAGIRTLIEAICLEIGIKEGTKFNQFREPIIGKKSQKAVISNDLEGKIFGLYENNCIIWEEQLILQEIRNISNTALHEIKSPLEDDLLSSMHIIERVLESVFELKNNKLLTK